MKNEIIWYIFQCIEHSKPSFLKMTELTTVIEADWVLNEKSNNNN